MAEVFLLRHRLRAAKVSEQVAELLVAQAVEQAFGHETAAGGLKGLDFRGAQCCVFPIERAEHQCVGVAIGYETGEGAAVFRFDFDGGVAFANFGIGIEYAQEQRAEVVALICREVGTDVAALEKQFVAGGAALHEERFTGVRISRTGAQGGFDGADPPGQFSGRAGAGVAKQCCGQAANRRGRVGAEAFGDLRRHRRKAHFARLQGAEQKKTRRGAAGR